MQDTSSSVTVDSVSLLLKDCASKEDTHEVIDILSNLSKNITPLLLIVKEEGKGLINEKGLNSLKSIADKGNLQDINYIIASLLNKILLKEFFEVICTEESIMIDLLKFILNSIEKIKESGVLCHLLIRKAHLFMTHLFKKATSATKPLINDLIKGYPIYHSNTFKQFEDLLSKSNALNLLNSLGLKEKEEGLSILTHIISYDNVFFAEQFELFYLSTPNIVSTLLKEPKEAEIPAYILYAHTLLRLLFYSKYKLNLSATEDDSSTDESKIIFIINDNKVGDLRELLPLDEKVYELSYHKELLELNEANIVDICLMLIESVKAFDHNFQMQFTLYVILKRMYFIFPSCRKEIESFIPSVLSNLCKFQGQKEWNQSLECRQFAYYLLTNDSVLKTKIKSTTVVNHYNMCYESLSLRDMTMSIGYPYTIELKAGEAKDKIIEVSEHNSLVYISLDEVEDREIKISFLKYNSEAKAYEPIIEKEEVNGDGKVVLISKIPGVYLIRFDNTSSWFNERKLRYQIVNMQSIS